MRGTDGDESRGLQTTDQDGASRVRVAHAKGGYLPERRGSPAIERANPGQGATVSDPGPDPLCARDPEDRGRDGSMLQSPVTDLALSAVTPAKNLTCALDSTNVVIAWSDRQDLAQSELDRGRTEQGQRSFGIDQETPGQGLVQAPADSLVTEVDRARQG